MVEILDMKLNTIGYTEYHGTSDSMPDTFVTDYEKEMQGQKKYFLPHSDHECICSDNIDVYLMCYYGEKYWPSKVCMKCRVITGITSPYEPDWGYHYPTNEEKKPWTDLYKEGYPKDGDPRKLINA